MCPDSKWNERYLNGTTSWDLGREDRNIVRLIGKLGIKSCNALEIGCGSGNNAIWLAKQGFEVTAVDLSEIAIEMAREKAKREGVKCNFLALDFLDKTPPGKFVLALDRGCFHSFDGNEERLKFALNISSVLVRDGIWISILGNADDKPRETGPPMRSASEIVTAVEPNFEILSLTSARFDSLREKPARSWELVCRKRSPGTYYEQKMGNNHFTQES